MKVGRDSTTKRRKQWKESEMVLGEWRRGGRRQWGLEEGMGRCELGGWRAGIGKEMKRIRAGDILMKRRGRRIIGNGAYVRCGEKEFWE